MLAQIFRLIMYILALYGFISIIATIVRRFYRNINLRNSNMRMALIVKNQGEIIEGVVRSIFSGGILESIIQGDNFYIVDMGSTDKTVEILQRLKNTYHNMEILSEKDKDKIFDDFSEEGTKT
ncbi:MAG: hypothetical protein HPY74_05085 [Firmicutes bacterium]|nr:hypothetical protein [Bacillota bacterium]